MVYGLVQIGGGAGLVVQGLIFSDVFSSYAGWITAALGGLLVLGGAIWIPRPSERPLGVTLLGASYAIAGLIILGLGGWFLTILFLPSLIFFALAWALLRGLAWGRVGAYLVAFVGILLSLAGVGNNGVTNLTGVLGGAYVFWYLNRSHVAEFFHGESLPSITTSKRFLATLVMIGLALTPIFAYIYQNPPTFRVISDRLEGWSSSGGSESGSGVQFYASKGDAVDYSYQVIAAAPVRVYFELSDLSLRCPTPSSPVGGSYSGRIVLPCSGTWILWVVSNGTHMNTRVEATRIMFSLRPSIVQWILLSVWTAGVLTYVTFTSRPVSDEREQPTKVEER